MGNKKNEARELVDLDVKEVSMVDKPANLREFLVVKRLEETMGAFESDATGVDPTQIGISENQTPVAKSDEGLAADLASVTEFIAKAKGGDADDLEKAVAPDLKAAIERVMAFLGKVSSGKMDAGKKAPTQKAKGKGKPPQEAEEEMAKRHSIEASLLKAGKLKEDEEAMKARHKAEMDELKKAKAEAEGGDGEGDDASKKAGVKKSAEPEGEAPSVQIYEDGRVVVQGQPVTKARGFTSNRTNTVKDVIQSLASMLKDVDEEAFKAVMGAIGGTPVNNLPPGAKVDSQVRPQGTTGVAKSEDGDGEGATVLELLKDLGGRLEAIEKARNPSTSVEGEGGTDSTANVQKSFWSGVL